MYSIVYYYHYSTVHLQMQLGHYIGRGQAQFFMGVECGLMDEKLEMYSENLRWLQHREFIH